MRRALAFIAAIVAAWPGQTYAAGHRAPKPTPRPIVEKIREKQAIIEATRHKLEVKRGQLHQARFKVQTIGDQLHATQVGIARVRAAISDLDWSIGRTQRRLEVKQRQLEAARQSLDRHRGALSRRLVGIYEFGTGSYLGVLLSATSFTDFVERWDFLRFIIKSDAALIGKINVAQNNYAKAVDELEAVRAELNGEEQDQERKHQELSILADQRRTLLAQAQVQRNALAHQVYELEGLTAAEEARLQELIREKQREDQLAVLEARRAAWAARRAAAIAAGLPPPVEQPLGGPIAFAWPVQGPVVSAFGMRVDPVTGRYQLHAGIDIAAGYGTSIGASADGVVIYAGWYGGYGNAIIVDHGLGLSTLYAHCSAVYVALSQRVQRGQVIGSVGATGWATGPHLHFEIRVNGVPVNPLTRL